MENKNDVVESEEQKLSARFNYVAQQLSKEYGFDLEDLKAAYKDKPESLIQHYNTAGDAKSERNSWIGWSVVWLIFIPPVAIYTVYRAIDEQMKASKTESMVEGEIDRTRLLPGKGDRPRLT